jgi:Tfp pilus assembly protein PilE
MSRTMPTRSARGTSMTELLVVCVVIGVLACLAVPQYRRSVEQNRLDGAAQQLRSIWAAQRVYWLEHRTFASDLSDLSTLDLIEPGVASGSDQLYAFTITSANALGFTARATRSGGSQWSGQLTIDQTGDLTGSVAGPSVTLTPSSY